MNCNTTKKMVPTFIDREELMFILMQGGMGQDAAEVVWEFYDFMMETIYEDIVNEYYEDKMLADVGWDDLWEE